MFKREGDKEVPEPFAEMARFFTESRLLQRDVKLLLEGVSNQIVLATVLHPVSLVKEWVGGGGVGVWVHETGCGCMSEAGECVLVCGYMSEAGKVDEWLHGCVCMNEAVGV